VLSDVFLKGRKMVTELHVDLDVIFWYNMYLFNWPFRADYR